MRRFTIFSTILFGAFIVWIIFMADTGRDSVFFRFARSLPLGDKLGHFFLYGLLAFGLNLSLRHRSFRLLGLSLPLGASVLLLVVAGEELSQAFIPSRTLDAGDLLADLLGVSLFGWLSFRPVFRRLVGSGKQD